MALGPTQSFTKDNVKTRWGERYVSDSLNKKFLGVPRGVYLGFVPSQSGLVLTLKTDQAVTLVGAIGTFALGATITGITSGATATVRVATAGYLLIDNVAPRPFLAGETITAPGSVSATVGAFTTEGISVARVVTSTPLVPGRSEDMVDIVTGDNVVLDFTGFADATYFVIATASYQVGQPTTAAIISRTAPPPDGVTEILVCKVTKNGASLTVDALAPTSRQEPFAFAGQRIGFMPGGSIESLLAAVATTKELTASRQDTSGTTAPTYDNATPQATGVPSRLASDLSRTATAGRLGKRQVIVQGNDYDPAVSTPISSVGQTGTADPVFNISGSFAGRTRDHMPFQDATNGVLPGQTLTFTSVSGAFVVGESVKGSSGSTAIVQAVTSPTITIYDMSGYGFNNGELVTGLTSGATATVVSSTGGVRVPVVLGTAGSDVITLTMSGVVGSYSVGAVATGSSSGAQGIIRSVTVTGTIVDLTDLFGFFRVGETIVSPGATGTLTTIDQRLGAVTAFGNGAGGDTVRNIVNIVETKAGRKPVDTNGNPIYGRLLFGPNGTSSAGGGAPGELLVAASNNQQINFTNGSTTVTNNNLDFTLFCLPGDIIEGADGRFYEISPVSGSVTTTTLTLTADKSYLGPNASAGFGVGPGPRRRRRYLLKPVVLSGGVESSATLTVGTNIPAGASLRVFFPCWFTEAQSNFDADFVKQAPGDGHISATQTVPGVGIVANKNETPPAAPNAVFGVLQNFQNNGNPLAATNFHTINFAAGGASAAGGVITIPAIAGPPGSGGGPGPPGPAGPAGPGFSNFAVNFVGIFPSGPFPANSTGTMQTMTTFPGIPILKMYAVCATYEAATRNLSVVDNIFITGSSAIIPSSNPGTNTVTITLSGRSFDGNSDSNLHVYVMAAG